MSKSKIPADKISALKSEKRESTTSRSKIPEDKKKTHKIRLKLAGLKTPA